MKPFSLSRETLLSRKNFFLSKNFIPLGETLKEHLLPTPFFAVRRRQEPSIPKMTDEISLFEMMTRVAFEAILFTAFQSCPRTSCRICWESFERIVSPRVVFSLNYTAVSRYASLEDRYRPLFTVERTRAYRHPLNSEAAAAAASPFTRAEIILSLSFSRRAALNARATQTRKSKSQIGLPARKLDAAFPFAFSTAKYPSHLSHGNARVRATRAAYPFPFFQRNEPALRTPLAGHFYPVTFERAAVVGRHRFRPPGRAPRCHSRVRDAYDTWTKSYKRPLRRAMYLCWRIPRALAGLFSKWGEFLRAIPRRFSDYA